MNLSIRELYKILKQEFEVPHIRKLKPVEELVLTILSQNTSDRNRDLAWKRLRERFPDLEKIINAKVEEIEDIIKPAGLYKQKAKRIKEGLTLIKRKFGKLEIPLKGKNLYDFLINIKGVGPKTAAVVALFSYGEPYFPVDIHIFRVARRIPLANGKTREEVQEKLTHLVPDHLKMELHLLLIELGRKYCRPRPKCTDCPLRGFCEYAKKIGRQITGGSKVAGC